MVIDYVTGVLAACLCRSGKTEGGGLSSAVGWAGLAKKIGTLLLVLVAHGLDIVGDDCKDVICLVEGIIHSSTRITNKSDSTWEWGNYIRVDDATGNRLFFCHLASLLCKECMRQGLMSVNYGALIQLPKGEKAEKQPFSPEELKRLWSACDGGDNAAAAILIMCYTGMRPGELLGVRIEEHIKPGYFLTGSKTDAGRNRIIPIADLIRPLVERLAAGRAAGPLVTTPTGGSWRVDNWRNRVFNRAMERLGITGATPYTGRHTYADIQKRRSVDPEIIMEIMGHEDYATTVEHYHTTTAEDIARICQAVAGLERPA